MASHNHSCSPLAFVFTTFKICFCLLFLYLIGAATAELSPDFYNETCPDALSIIESAVNSAVKSEPRMGASLLRLHFHDCFVNASHAPFFYCISIFNIYFYTLLSCMHGFIIYLIQPHIYIYIYIYIYRNL